MTTEDTNVIQLSEWFSYMICATCEGYENYLVKHLDGKFKLICVGCGARINLKVELDEDDDN